jgi:hypothetical protein
MLLFSMLLLLIGSFALMCGLVVFCGNVIRPQAGPSPEALVHSHEPARQHKKVQIHLVRAPSA